MEDFGNFMTNMVVFLFIMVAAFSLYFLLAIAVDKLWTPYFGNKKIALTQRIQTGIMIVFTIIFIVFGVLFYKKDFRSQNSMSINNCLIKTNSSK